MRLYSLLVLIISVTACKQKIDKKQIIGSWITSSVHDSVLSIHTFDREGNYFIDDSSNGKVQRQFTMRYRITDDGKYLIPTLAGGGEPQMDLTKLTSTELELTIGSYTRKYKRYKYE